MNTIIPSNMQASRLYEPPPLVGGSNSDCADSRAEPSSDEANSGSLPADVLEVLTQLGRRKWFIARITGGAIVLGISLSLALPVRYTAVTRIMPPQQVQSSASALMAQIANSGASALTAVAGKQLGLKNPNDIYLGLLGSRPVADVLIQQFGLSRLYRARDMTEARKILADNTSIQSEKNGFVSVAVTDGDARRAAGIANGYTEQLRMLTKTLAVTEASRRRLFYENQLSEARETLVAAELSMRQIQQQKGLIQLDTQAKSMIEGVAGVRAAAAAKQVEIDAERSYSTDLNPDVQLAERELGSLRTEIAQLEHRSRNSPGDLELGDVPGAGLDYLRAERELKYRQAILDILMRQYDAARLDEAQDAAIIQVLEPAIPPDRRSAPERIWIVLISAISGLGGGCLLALLSWWQSVLRSDPERAEQIRNMRVAFLGS